MNVKDAILTATLAMALTACGGPTEITGDAVIIHGGDIVSLTDENPEALLVNGNSIHALGSLDDLRDRAPNAQLIDLKGQALLPGFIDSHVHVRELGMDEVKADLVGVKTVDDIVVRLKARYPDPKPGTWLIGQGWDEGYFGSIGYPDRAALDTAFPDNPLHLESLHGFAGFYNGAALAIAGIDDATPDPAVGNILHREDGSPTGVMLTLAQGLINQHIPPISIEQRQAAIKAGLLKMRAAGVTSIHEAGMTPDDVTAFKNLAANGELPIRVYGLLDGNNSDLMDNWFASGILDDPQDWLDIRGIKVFYDGSLGSRTALMHAPYSDKPDEAKPTARIHLDDIDKLAIQAVDKGFQMAIHAIGDEGNDCVIANYELRLADRKIDHRWRIEHAQVVLPDFFKRQAQLGVLASMQSSHAMGDSDWAEDRVGPERIKNAYAWRTMLDHGGRVMINSDLPGEPWEPMQTLHFAVTRTKLDGSPDGGWYKEQALSVDEALKAMTIENAYGAFQDEKLGTLEAGKWADFVVLDKNPYTVGETALQGIDVKQVWVAGERVE